MTNQFKIKEHKVLNDVVNNLVVNGNIQLFAEQFTVNYSLNKTTESTEFQAGPMIAGNNINGSLVILRASLADLTEESIVAEVAAQLGIELA